MADKEFDQSCDFKGIKRPVKIRDIRKIENENRIGISVFGYENKEKHPVYVSKKCCEEKYVHLSLIGEERKSHYVLITDFNTSILTFYIAEKKQFCRYCLQAFGKETISKRHIKDCFTFNAKKVCNA